MSSAYHLYPLQIKKFDKINKIKFMNNLKDKNIHTQIHYLPLNRQPLYKLKNSKFPEVKFIMKNLLVFQCMTKSHWMMPGR